MNIFHFIFRILLCLFTAINALVFLHLGENIAAGASLLLAICYAWPLLWVAVKHMRIRTAAPMFSADNRETNIQTIRRAWGLVLLIIALVQFSEKRNGAGIIAIFLVITTIRPFNKIFFAPSIKWTANLRNLGLFLCFFAILLDPISIPVVGWIGFALVVLHPLFLVRTGRSKEFITSLTLPPQPPKEQLTFKHLIQRNAATRAAVKVAASPEIQAMISPPPQLDDPRYFEIIDYIIRLGRDFENYPELNENFNEERYRNYFLPFLNSVSPGYAAKGEVFHGKGKTDILVWDKNGVNLFVAECKIWRGEAYLLEGVDQLLTRYVNWRDEKTALIVFNREIQNFSVVIEAATRALSSHTLCREPGRPRTDCSWSYQFHHPTDNARIIRLELILLNFWSRKICFPAV